MLSVGTLVKIKNTRGTNWNYSGLMDRFKGKWAIISRAVGGSYFLEPLPFSTDASIENWQWLEEDFVLTETHCCLCGELLKETKETTKEKEKLFAICRNCETIKKEEAIFALRLNINKLMNLALSSKILPVDLKTTILKAIENDDLYTCADCGKILDSLNYQKSDGKYICEDCRGNYYMCEDCGKLFLRGEEVIGQSGRIYCSIECQEACDPFNFSEELPYNAKPPVHFLGSDNKEELYLGAEIEVDGDYENKEDCIYDIYLADKKEVYCKHDGSLSGGFEFVTHPATLEYHKKELKYDKLIDICKKWDFSGDSYDTTGLHVHASKAFFGKEEEAHLNALKLEFLFEKFWGKMLLFANRSIEGAERWAKRRQFYERYRNRDINEEMIKNLIEIMKADRYTAINITNKTTIEFRLFKGTTRKQRIFAILEMVDYLCRYVKNVSLEKIKEITFEELFEGVIDNNNYTNLKFQLEYLKLIEETKIA